MDINGWEIIQTAHAFSNQMLNDQIKKEPITIDVIKDVRSPQVLATKYGTDIVTNLIIGALEEYHSQLRDKLLESGIDIGEMSFD